MSRHGVTAGRNLANNSEFGDVMMAFPWQKQHWRHTRSRIGVPAAWHRQQSRPSQTATNPSDSHWLGVRWEWEWEWEWECET